MSPAMERDWIVPDWPAPAAVRALITTRSEGESRGPYASLNLGMRVGDEPRAVLANRARLRRHLPAEPLWLGQVHGTNVVDAATAAPECEADGAVAREPNKVLAVLTADCLPVLLCDRPGSRVGIAHAGWRGLAAGILERTVDAMAAAPAELLAYLGPGIGPRAYEVGPEVRDEFLRRDPAAAAAFLPGRGDRFLADLYALARQRLMKTGIMAVFGGNHCTYHEHERFFSYRRDGVTGRMASVIWLERA
jgi:YfiH family protein